jgi:murein peptide amidase A
VTGPAGIARMLAAAIALAAGIGLAGGIAGGDSDSRQRTHNDRADQPAAPKASDRQTMTIGYSVRHRPIRAVLVGDPRSPRSVLVVGCIHGNERAGITVAKLLAARASPPRTALWIVPVLNPDGAAADTRQNGRGVDLNRNFPYQWRPLGSRGYLQYSGPRPLSEPESRAAAKLILRVRPQITIWFHQPLGLVDLSGGNAALERRFGRVVGLPVLQLIRYPGSAVGWENRRLPKTTAFVVELPPGALSSRDAARYAAAVLGLAGAPAARRRS